MHQLAHFSNFLSTVITGDWTLKAEGVGKPFTPPNVDTFTIPIPLHYHHSFSISKKDHYILYVKDKLYLNLASNSDLRYLTLHITHFHGTTLISHLVKPRVNHNAFWWY